METIFKYKLLEITRQIIELPIGYQILSVKAQEEDLCMWVLVDADCNEKQDVEIEIFGTGRSIYENEKTKREFLETCIMPSGLVWHIFKRLS